MHSFIRSFHQTLLESAWQASVLASAAHLSWTRFPTTPWGTRPSKTKRSQTHKPLSQVSRLERWWNSSSSQINYESKRLQQLASSKILPAGEMISVSIFINSRFGSFLFLRSPAGARVSPTSLLHQGRHLIQSQQTWLVVCLQTPSAIHFYSQQSATLH